MYLIVGGGSIARGGKLSKNLKWEVIIKMGVDDFPNKYKTYSKNA